MAARLPSFDRGEEDVKVKGETAFSSQLLDMYSGIYTMRQDLERVKKPIGTKDNPVRTCRDLFYGHPQFGDGKAAIRGFENVAIAKRYILQHG